MSNVPCSTLSIGDKTKTIRNRLVKSSCGGKKGKLNETIELSALWSVILSYCYLLSGVYGVVADPCSPSPCPSEATCEATSVLTFICHCPPGLYLNLLGLCQGTSHVTAGAAISEREGCVCVFISKYIFIYNVA